MIDCISRDSSECYSVYIVLEEMTTIVPREFGWLSASQSFQISEGVGSTVPHVQHVKSRGHKDRRGIVRAEFENGLLAGALEMCCCADSDAYSVIAR